MLPKKEYAAGKKNVSMIFGSITLQLIILFKCGISHYQQKQFWKCYADQAGMPRDLFNRKFFGKGTGETCAVRFYKQCCDNPIPHHHRVPLGTDTTKNIL